ncbi:MAG TPA: histidinol phosphate phosphatase domain-containing protein [Dehalococcoidia bacterium]|nr:histidinol phosphate phosphatase domain-containing protein [Dehalococcoidia bacterium]
MIYDFHTHSTLSDGQLSPVELVRRAVVLGYAGMAITDHAGVGSLERFAYELQADCTLASEMWGIDVFPGVELTHVPAQSIDECARKARAAGAAIVVVHGETVVEPVEPGTNMAAIMSDSVDVLGHPGLISLEEAELAAERGIFLELSARRSHCVANGHVARIARLAGARLILDSDQHDLDFLTTERQRYVALGAGLAEEDLEDVFVTNPQLLLKQLKERSTGGARL